MENIKTPKSSKKRKTVEIKFYKFEISSEKKNNPGVTGGLKKYYVKFKYILNTLSMERTDRSKDFAVIIRFFLCKKHRK